MPRWILNFNPFSAHGKLPIFVSQISFIYKKNMIRTHTYEYTGLSWLSTIKFKKST